MKCKFFHYYQQCKFGEYCSYSHQATQNDLVLMDMKLKIEQLENTVKEQGTESNEMKTKIVHLENENTNFKNELENILKIIKDVTEKAIVDATKSLVKRMSDQQESLEVYTNTIISSLQEQMTITSNLSDSTLQPLIL